MQSSNKTIAQNTLFLYFRMMFTMVISLFTSRIILQKLGIDDYGIYQAVGGVVGFLSYINGALATGSSRFITFALGENNIEKLKKTFSTTLNIHILISSIVVILAETVGIWFIYNKMVIAPNRIDAAIFTFHLSVLTSVITLTQVPYNATIIAHEKMSIYAYMSIFEASAKLAICYLLSIGSFDKLKLYATLLFIVQLFIMGFYRFYCTKHFKEARFSFTFDKKIFCEIAGFSGWSMFSQTSIALNSQGVLILLNLFFSPAVVTARAISLQVNMAANQLVTNFRQAVNPQIVKKYAAGDVKGSKQLLLSSTKYSYYLMFIICFPICLLAEPILKLWLGIVPEYTVIFLQLILIQSLFQVFDTSFYTALYAKGQLKENALISPTLGFLRFPIIYILFKHGYSPVVLSWACLISYAILGLIIKPILIIRIVNYTWNDIWMTIKPCITITLYSLPIPILFSKLTNVDLKINICTTIFLTIFITCTCIYFWGIDKETRNIIIKYLHRKINNF